MNKNDRVKHSFLGKGIFIKKISFLSLVKWDKKPSIKYNMGENPCAVFTKKLKIIK